jgi:hypothetical protein
MAGPTDPSTLPPNLPPHFEFGFHLNSNETMLTMMLFPSLLLSSDAVVEARAAAFISSSSSFHPHPHQEQQRRQRSRDRRRTAPRLAVSRSSVPPIPSHLSLGDSYFNEDITSSSSSSLERGAEVGFDVGYEALGLSPSLTRSVSDMGWNVPTPIQRLAIPAILDMTSPSRTTDADGEEDVKRDSIWCEGPTGR